MKKELSEYINRSAFIYFFFVIILAVSSAASAASLDETISMIEKKAGEIKDISGSFLQESYLTDLERTEKYSGNFFIKKPSMVRWKYAEPRDEEVYITTDAIWIHKRLAKQAVKSKFTENAYGQAPIALLASLQNLKADFDITATGKADILKLKPKRKIGSIKEILMQTSSTDFPVNSFKIFDIYGNNVIITIKDVRTNTGLEDKAFIFKPTADMEIFEY
ncbi:MAG: outer membrane lipoprotein carrier protein LolA [Thermodesulfovibrionia bacterium]|nr:outer membrane lipoprotein carrier protein LolA [Thermodesulfovibrionia bacterium]